MPGRAAFLTGYEQDGRLPAAGRTTLTASIGVLLGAPEESQSPNYASTVYDR